MYDTHQLNSTHKKYQHTYIAAAFMTCPTFNKMVDGPHYHTKSSSPYHRGATITPPPLVSVFQAYCLENQGGGNITKMATLRKKRAQNKNGDS